MSRATSSTCVRSAEPSSSCGVPTAMNRTSLVRTASARSVVKRRRSSATLRGTSSFEARLVDRDLAPAQRVDLVRVDVDADDGVAVLGEARPDHEADVARPDDSDVHLAELLPRPKGAEVSTSCYHSVAHELRPRRPSLALASDRCRDLRAGARRAPPRARPRGPLHVLLGLAQGALPRSRLAGRTSRLVDRRDPGARPERGLEPPRLAADRPPGRPLARPRALADPAAHPVQARPPHRDAARPLLPQAPRARSRARRGATS